MTIAEYDKLDALLLRARKADMGALLHPMLVLYCDRGDATGYIGKRTGVGSAAMTGTIDRMVALGWAQRSDAPEDRRLRVIRLTDAGLAVCREVFGELTE